MPSKEELQYLQSLSLEEKIQKSTARIIEWYENWGGQVYIAFSGGKDSTVLLNLVRKIYPEVPALFVNTGLEYPELQRFAKGTENTLVVRPKMMFTEVIKNYGYPLISKEVSEAIYYARKLGGAKRQSRNEKNSMGNGWIGNSCQTDRTAWSKNGTNKTTTSPVGRQTTWKRLELGGGRPTCSRAEYFEFQEKSANGLLSSEQNRGCL